MLDYATEAECKRIADTCPKRENGSWAEAAAASAVRAIAYSESWANCAAIYAVQALMAEQAISRQDAITEVLACILETARLYGVQYAPDHIQVAWDAVQEGTSADLPAARARAQRLGLDWNDPFQRAIAERATDEDHIRAILYATP